MSRNCLSYLMWVAGGAFLGGLVILIWQYMSEGGIICPDSCAIGIVFILFGAGVGGLLGGAVSGALAILSRRDG